TVMLSRRSIVAQRSVRVLASSPTRRSSDLDPHSRRVTGLIDFERVLWADPLIEVVFIQPSPDTNYVQGFGETLFEEFNQVRRRRSEEHTSELQSREKLVCRLLLEKKKETGI